MLNVVADALLPPASLAVLAFLLFLFAPRRRRIGLAVLAALLAFGTEAVSAALFATLTFPPAAPGPEPQAIVILSGDAVRMPEPAPLEPGSLTLERMRAGAALHRRTGLPVLVSGGPFLGTEHTLAAMMAASLHDDFRVDVRWEEDRSLDTWQNAEFSAAILRPARDHPHLSGDAFLAHAACHARLPPFRPRPRACARARAEVSSLVVVLARNPRLRLAGELLRAA